MLRACSGSSLLKRLLPVLRACSVASDKGPTSYYAVVVVSSIQWHTQHYHPWVDWQLIPSHPSLFCPSRLQSSECPQAHLCIATPAQLLAMSVKAVEHATAAASSACQCAFATGAPQRLCAPQIQRRGRRRPGLKAPPGVEGPAGG